MSTARRYGAGAILRRAEAWLGLKERRCTACREPFVPVLTETGSGPSFVEDVLNSEFCPACRKRLKRRESGFCPYCGAPSALEDAPCMPCARCLEKLPPWHDFLFFGVYGGLLREMLLRAKFSGSLADLRVLGRLLAAVCAEHYAAAPLPDVVVPVPLDSVRLRRRGFNQCRELSRSLSASLKLPVCTDILVKTGQVLPQEALNREQRLQMKQPFAVARSVEGEHVLLVDDVCTTGTTLRRAAECLLKAGASGVDVVVLARASLHGRQEESGVTLP